ncbi:MAG: leucyl aminopeptidase family protein [Pseudobdellovibrio sp.]
MNVQSVLKSKFQFEINTKIAPKAQAFVYLLGDVSESRRKIDFKKIIEQHAFSQQIAQLQGSDKRVLHFVGQSGPVWILQNAENKKYGHAGLLDETAYAWFRDQVGTLVSQFKTHAAENIIFNCLEASSDILRASIIGLELASYNFLNTYSDTLPKNSKIYFSLSSKKKNFKLDLKFINQCLTEAHAVQLARHLVNLPPNDINPQSFEDIAKKQLSFPKTVTVEVWDHKKLAAENMNLHLAVGKGSDTPPRMLRIKYRPKKKSSKKPIAFVGKGITFDTGGLDIKPSSGMRLMKKDMGGAAAVLGLAYWAAHSDYERPCDFYLALAENSVDANSMRPSDLYRSRAGYLVEIDNTDAEGRLVLADVMDVAVKQKGNDEPEFVIDIATLTGAIKVALGADVAGLFTNDDTLANQLQTAGQKSGEPNWRMPLVQKYFGSMTSNFADFKNSADGFGGAITAALFLEKFCGGKKWAHLDVYCWNDKNTGALSFAGGSGQPVQSMIEWLKSKT